MIMMITVTAGTGLLQVHNQPVLVSKDGGSSIRSIVSAPRVPEREEW